MPTSARLDSERSRRNPTPKRDTGPLVLSVSGSRGELGIDKVRECFEALTVLYRPAGWMCNGPGRIGSGCTSTVRRIWRLRGRDIKGAPIDRAGCHSLGRTDDRDRYLHAQPFKITGKRRRSGHQGRGSEIGRVPATHRECDGLLSGSVTAPAPHAGRFPLPWSSELHA